MVNIMMGYSLMAEHWSLTSGVLVRIQLAQLRMKLSPSGETVKCSPWVLNVATEWISLYVLLAQLEEHPTFNRVVESSSLL